MLSYDEINDRIRHLYDLEHEINYHKYIFFKYPNNTREEKRSTIEEIRKANNEKKEIIEYLNSNAPDNYKDIIDEELYKIEKNGHDNFFLTLEFPEPNIEEMKKLLGEQDIREPPTEMDVVRHQTEEEKKLDSVELGSEGEGLGEYGGKKSKKSKSKRKSRRNKRKSKRHNKKSRK